MSNKKIYLERMGCNRRLLELTKIKKYLGLNGYTFVENPDNADYILLSTCAFKEKEENFSVSRLRDLSNYDAELLVYGCLPDIAPQKYIKFNKLKHLAPKDLDQIDSFFDGIQKKYSEVADANSIAYDSGNYRTSIKNKLISKELFAKHSCSQTMISGIKQVDQLLNKSRRDYYLFVCRGCRGKCAYCAIRYSVGPVKSKSVSEIANEFRSGIKDGYRKFSVLGDDPGCYGLDINQTFPDLLNTLLKEYSFIRQARQRKGQSNLDISFHIKEIHPKYLLLYKNELIRIFKSNKFKSILCPIQSGNNRILELMQREHSAEDFKKMIHKIRSINPGIELSTQIIVGFPSETDEEFHDTLLAVKELCFDSVVVFPYHDKKHTASFRLADKIPEQMIQQRFNEAFVFFEKHKIKAYEKCPS